MNRSWWTRATFLILVVLVSLMMLVPTFLPVQSESYPFKRKINLGLDLQGGLYLVLGIDFKKVYRDELSNQLKSVITTLNDEGIKAEEGFFVENLDNDPFKTFKILDPSKKDQALKVFFDYFRYSLRRVADEGTTITVALESNFREELENNSVKKSIEVIRNRIDEFGVTEPEIFSQGEDRIVVQLPGVKDIERAKALIGRTAKLSFRIVNDEVSPVTLNEWVEKAKAQGLEYKKGERFSQYLDQLNQMYQKELPKGFQLAFEKSVNPNTNEVLAMIPMLVESVPKVVGDDLQDAMVRMDQETNQPYVGLTFKPKGANKFEEVTGENINKRLAIVLDGNIYSAPVIQTRIAGGQAQISLGSGNYNDLMKEARDLALVLRAGALPVELEFQEQRIIGPSLGKESIQSSSKAGIIAALLVFLFVLVYYKFSGLLAIKTLFINIVIIMAALVGLEATLTLPGIAGIALTVGMAVDANIIIYERIKEELALGTRVKEAIETGFSKAFWTILDANLTTAVAGIMLLNFGTGPIRGFAVTLIIGIGATIYSSYFVGRILFEWVMRKRLTGEQKSLSI